MKGSSWFYERGEGDADPRPLTLRSLMTANVQTLNPEQLVGDAIRLIVEHDIRHVPIVRGAELELVGLVSETDILRKVMHGRTMSNDEEYHAFLDAMLPLEEVMVKEVATLPPEAKVAEAVALFLQRKIRCVPVVNERRRLLGIVTETDLMMLLEHMVRG
jgi:CBS domain-containing protein